MGIKSMRWFPRILFAGSTDFGRKGRKAYETFLVENNHGAAVRHIAVHQCAFRLYPPSGPPDCGGNQCQCPEILEQQYVKPAFHAVRACV